MNTRPDHGKECRTVNQNLFCTAVLEGCCFPDGCGFQMTDFIPGVELPFIIPAEKRLMEALLVMGSMAPAVGVPTIFWKTAFKHPP